MIASIKNRVLSVVRLVFSNEYVLLTHYGCNSQYRKEKGNLISSVGMQLKEFYEEREKTITQPEAEVKP